MDINNKIVARLKQVRLEKNILQRYVADSIGISQAAYARIENGQTQLTINTLYKVAETLDCKIATILDIESESSIHNIDNLVMTNINKGHLVVNLNAKEASELLAKMQEK